MIIQGQNNPIVVEFDEAIETDEIHARLTNQADGKELKHWEDETVTVSGNRVTLPLTQEETIGFPAGSAVLEIKFMDNDGIVEFSEKMKIKIDARYDHHILGGE